MMKTVTSLGLCLGLMLTLVAPAALADDIANMSGTWKLNTKRSKFDKNAAPLNVLLKIEHSEPSLKYTGTVQGSQEGHPDTFQFDGAIDEKIYPVKENANTGRTIKFKRASDRTVESWSSDANNMEEYATTTVLRDGKSLVRKMTVKDKSGRKRTWTEVYEKQS